MEHAKSDAALIVGVTAGGDAKVLASEGVPANLASWQGEVDVIDAALGRSFVSLSAGAFAASYTIPLLSEGDLFGALILFSAQPDKKPSLAMAQSLAELAAMT